MSRPDTPTNPDASNASETSTNARPGTAAVASASASTSGSAPASAPSASSASSARSDTSSDSHPHSTPHTLPDVRTSLEPDEIVARIAKLSQRGRIPGFERGSGGVLFTATAFGQPFDRTLEAHIDAGKDEGGDTDKSGGTTLHFSTRLKPALPWTFAIITALSIWPGVWLTDELLRTYFLRYDYATWMWYLPITIIPLPWMVRAMMRKSEAAAAESAHDLIERIREAVDGTAVQDADAP